MCIRDRLQFDPKTVIFGLVILVIGVGAAIGLAFLLKRQFGDWVATVGQEAPAFDVLVVLVTTTLFVGASAMLLVINPVFKLLRGSPVLDVKTLGEVSQLSFNPQALTTMFALTVALAAISVGIGLAWGWRRYASLLLRNLLHQLRDRLARLRLIVCGWLRRFNRSGLSRRQPKGTHRHFRGFGVVREELPGYLLEMVPRAEDWLDFQIGTLLAHFLERSRIQRIHHRQCEDLSQLVDRQQAELLAHRLWYQFEQILAHVVIDQADVGNLALLDKHRNKRGTRKPTHIHPLL